MVCLIRPYPFKFWETVFHKFCLFRSWILVPFYQRLRDNVQLERWQSLCCSLQNISLYLGIKLTQHQRSVLLFDRQKIGGFLRPFVAITSSFSGFAREPLTGLLFVFSSSFSKPSEFAEADSFSLAHFPTAYLSFW